MDLRREFPPQHERHTQNDGPVHRSTFTFLMSVEFSQSKIRSVCGNFNKTDHGLLSFHRSLGLGTEHTRDMSPFESLAKP
jgi:hypothetical protein